MNRQPELSRGGDDLLELSDRPHAPTRVVVRVLERDDRDALVGDLRARRGGVPDLLGRDAPAVSGEPVAHQPRVGRRPPVFVDEDVRGSLGEEDVARTAVELQGDLIRHRRGRDEQCLLLTEQPRDAGLELGDRRVLALLLVAHSGVGDGTAHAGRGLRDGVGAEVDHRSHATVLAWISRFWSRTLADRGEPRYRARQVWDWTARGSGSYDEMTTLAKPLRAALAEAVPFSTLEVDHRA